MVIITVCSYCRHHDNDPNIEINFKDRKIYYICSECKKESIISLKLDAQPFPTIRRM